MTTDNYVLLYTTSYYLNQLHGGLDCLYIARERMVIDVHVVLPSGRCSTISAEAEGTWEVADLMRLAEVQLGKIPLQALVSSTGRAPWIR